MLFNPKTNELFCFYCNDWKCIYTEVINPEPLWECLDCGNILAYDHDMGWLWENTET